MNEASEIDFCKNANHTWLGTVCQNCGKPQPTVIQTLYWAATALAGKNAELSDLRAKLEKAVQNAANYEMDKHKAEVNLAKSKKKVLAICQAWRQLRRHASDGDEAVSCCDFHYDAMDEAAHLDSGGEEKI